MIPRLTALLCGDVLPSRRRLLSVVSIALLPAVTLLWAMPDPLTARAGALAVFCLVRWLGEIVRPWVPTLLLLLLTPLGLGGLKASFGWAPVAKWLLEPVLALFLGGFALGLAATRFKLDAAAARLTLQGSRGSQTGLLILVSATTAGLSMWMSNVAAAAMMFGALRPLLANMAQDASLRRSLLLGVGMGANFGGMATPIGTGPNGLALAALEQSHPVSFLQWMTFSLPLAALMTGLAVVLVAWRGRLRGKVPFDIPVASALSGRGRALLVVFALTIALWMTETLHGIQAWQVALGAFGLLCVAGFLRLKDLPALDWSTLLLVAGGICLGRLLEQSGFVGMVAELVPWSQFPGPMRMAILCSASALLSSLMSNTAATAMLIPLATSFDPSPATPVLIALAASMGVPFVVSTPANAMAFGEGGLKTKDFLLSGLVLMAVGVALVAFTGPTILDWLGVP
jgi:sodium-dependent dicarboxylate transporter 2/3/5